MEYFLGRFFAGGMTQLDQLFRLAGIRDLTDQKFE
jgi:hypothetical protein